MRLRIPQPPPTDVNLQDTRSTRRLTPNHSSPEITVANAPQSHLVRRSDRLDQEVVLGLLPADDLSNDRLGDVEIEERDVRDSGLVAVCLEVIFFVYPSHFDKEDVGVSRRGQV
jgi:hypothetical protein